MPRHITRSLCMERGCEEESWFKRKCKLHYLRDNPGVEVREYRFTWNTVEKLEGSIRATSEEEAFRLAENGVIAPRKRQISFAEDVQLVGVKDV